jgi:hypothetical protein
LADDFPTLADRVAALGQAEAWSAASRALDAAGLALGADLNRRAGLRQAF